MQERLEQARQLGWACDTVLERARLFGVRAYAAVTIDRRAHRIRQDTRQGPVLDYDTLAMWEWPEWTAPRAPEVVRLLGVLVPGRSWRAALADACRLRGFAATAILASEPGEECLLECALWGVGVVDTATGRLAAPAASGRAPHTRRRALDRWIEELLYDTWLHQPVTAH